ncbi:rutC family protein UK114 [Anthonomus grandis grandis]|uniref:rutC family protein UK114 n=1 Tax=Anthonomus grandis grandis TaxID=2921223 RepID=UPI00216594C6|nr:rutC family protein UK114 [Anthonomus grandis grandis]
MPLLRKIINTNNAPRPIAPYNQGVVLESTLYVSGCLGLDKDTMKLVEGDVSTETRQALRNLGHILTAAETSYDKVIKTTIFMSDINDFAAINQVYNEFFTKDFPARSAVQVAKLPLNARVEIEVVAAVGTLKTVCCKH